MNKRVAVCVAALVLIGCAVFAAGRNVITGQVVNSKGKAVAGAKVYVYDLSVRQLEPVPATTLTTDKKGKFTYHLKNAQQPLFGQAFGVTAPGYAVGAGYSEESKPVKIVLSPPDWKLEGKAVDEQNKPLAGATVSVVTYYAAENEKKYANLPGPISGAMQTKTKSDGSFAIAGLPNPARFESYHVELRVTGKGISGVRKGFDESALGQAVTVTVPPACVLEGALYLPGKSGPASAGTKLRLLPIESPGLYERDVPVDAQGRFKVTDLPPGKMLISLTPGPAKMSAARLPVLAAPPRWVLPEMKEVLLSSLEPTDTELVLSSGAVIKGVVTSKKTGKPLPDAVVGFSFQPHPERTSIDLTTTDANGRFAGRVPAGKAKVSLVWAEGGYVGPFELSVELTVAEGEEKTDVKLEYDPEAPLPPELQPNAPVPPSGVTP